MSVIAGTSPEETRKRMSWTGRFTLWQALVIGCFGLFAWATAQFYQAETGFSSLIMIGDALNENKVTALRKIHHYVYDQSAGYDGSYYVQIALDPLLKNPETVKAIDNLSYRARRILFSWVAWGLGLGQPAWIVQAHALLNVGCWFILGILLLHWLPPTSGQNFLRWAAILFSQGACMSVRNSLADLPALLLVVWAVWLIERQRKLGGSVVLALAGMGKETSLSAVTAFADESTWHSPRGWLRLTGRIVLIALPLALWMVYIRLKLGPVGDAGLNNFTWPLLGLLQKWAFTWRDWLAHPSGEAQLSTLLTLAGVTVQFIYVASRWWPRQIWWRVGASSAALMAVVSQPVWEGYPGAFGRVLLPLCVAFNVLVSRERRWLPVLLAGNLSLLAGWREFSPPSEDLVRVRGARDLITHVEITPQAGWYGPESNLQARWRWTLGEATMRVHNMSPQPLTVTFHGQMSSLDPQTMRILAGEDAAWSGSIHAMHPVDFEFSRVIAPGDTVLRFVPEKPARQVGTDSRRLAVCVFNLNVTVSHAGGGP